MVENVGQILMLEVISTIAVITKMDYYFSNFQYNGKYDQAAIVPATTSGNIKGISHKILAFELFCGVGYYNQLFSLELILWRLSVCYLI